MIMSKITTLVAAEINYMHTLGMLLLYYWQLKEYNLKQMTSQGIITIQSITWHVRLLSKIDANDLALPAQVHPGWGPGNVVVMCFVV